MPEDRSVNERLAVIESTLLDIKKALYGNGQPGELQRLHGRISLVGDELDSHAHNCPVRTDVQSLMVEIRSQEAARKQAGVDAQRNSESTARWMQPMIKSGLVLLGAATYWIIQLVALHPQVMIKP